MPTTTDRRAIGYYLLITFSLSAVFYALIIHAGKLGSGYGLYVTGLMWCPGMSAIFTSLLLQRPLALLGWQTGRASLLFQSYFLPLLYALVAYTAIWIAGWGHFFDAGFVERAAGNFGWNGLPPVLTLLFYFIIMGLFGLPRSVASAMGEEIGWRGFLAPIMYNSLGYTKTSLLTGLIWSLWHFPILIFADYNSGTPTWYGLTCFTVMVIGISFAFTWYRLKSGSLWTGVLLHASHNLFIQNFFTPITGDTGKTSYFVDEFGAVLPVIAILVAIYFWRRRNELPPSAYTNMPI